MYIATKNIGTYGVKSIQAGRKSSQIGKLND